MTALPASAVAATAGDVFAPCGMAVTAVRFVELVTDVDRVNEFGHLGTGGDVLLGLPQHGVAEVAVLGDHLACR